jgi:ubiquinol-cytochrome c reductase cytochrome b subunit
MGNRMRASLSRWFFEDRIVPPTKGELESGHDHH